MSQVGNPIKGRCGTCDWPTNKLPCVYCKAEKEMRRSVPTSEDNDDWCCASAKLRISVESFDLGCLTTYKSVRHAVQRLTRDEVLEIIDQMIANIERRQL